MRPPEDKDLLRYFNWLKSTGGQGMGFEREVFAMPSNSASSLSSGAPAVMDICSPAVQSKQAHRTVGTIID